MYIYYIEYGFPNPYLRCEQTIQSRVLLPLFFFLSVTEACLELGFSDYDQTPNLISNLGHTIEIELEYQIMKYSYNTKVRIQKCVMKDLNYDIFRLSPYFV